MIQCNHCSETMQVVCGTNTFGSISPWNTGQGRIQRSLGQGQGHRSKKVQNSYSRNVKLQSAIPPVL